jgi:hypothetical protein
MNQEILCTWLGLSKAAWPPDPWTLLALAPGEHDLPTIEQRVQDRIAKLRHYQLSYPEEATEGMNRLAEAFVTLAEACAKGPSSGPSPVAMRPAASVAAGAASLAKKAETQDGATLSKEETSVSTNTKLDWRKDPPPVRQSAVGGAASAPELIRAGSVSDGTKGVSDGANEVLLSKPFVAPSKPIRRELDPTLVRQLAEESEEANSSIGTIDAVILRVEMTRRLLHAWERAGKLLRAGSVSDAIKQVSKKNSTKENEQFAKRLEAIADAMRGYPAFLGHPGKPGYRVVVLARLKIPLANVRAMAPEQRDELLFDHQAGYQVMLAHRKYLRRLFKSMRHRTTIGLILHAVRAALNDYPIVTLIGIALVVALALIGAAMLAF